MVDPVLPPASDRPTVARLRIQRDGALSGQRPARRWRVWAAAALLVAGGLTWFWMPRPVTVQVAPVVSTTVSQQFVQLTASGYVVAQRRAAVASKATGRLVELTVREGSHVREGEVIARLDASDVLAAVSAAEAAMRQAEAGVRQAEVEQANAEADLARSKGLQAQGFISPQAVDAVETRAKAARAAVQSARAAVASAQAQVKVQRVNQDFTEIRAPFTGVVLVKNANVGDIITPFSNAAGSQGAVVTMADMGTLEVEADVSEGSLSKASVNQPVEILLDALPGVRFRGSVGRIVPTVDRAKATVMTKIRFDRLDERVLPEMSAKVNFLSRAVTPAEQQPILAAPPQAVVSDAQGAHVWVLRREGNSESARFTVLSLPVQLGQQVGELREVRPVTAGSLQAGDKLVLAPLNALKPGAEVRLADK